MFAEYTGGSLIYLRGPGLTPDRFFGGSCRVFADDFHGDCPSIVTGEYLPTDR